MIYSIDQLKEKIAPIAAQYGLAAVWIFGSYARNEATDDSDVDFLIDRTGSTVKSLFHMAGVYNDFSEAIGKSIDLVTTAGINHPSSREMSPDLYDNINLERKLIYERQ